jgi:hypothetical protein
MLLRSAGSSLHRGCFPGLFWAEVTFDGTRHPETSEGSVYHLGKTAFSGHLRPEPSVLDVIDSGRFHRPPSPAYPTSNKDLHDRLSNYFSH